MRLLTKFAPFLACVVSERAYRAGHFDYTSEWHFRALSLFPLDSISKAAISPRQLNPNGADSVSSKHPENGASQSPSIISSEKVVEELLKHPVQGLDEHLVEFSEAIRTVAKALRRVTEGKATAQAEAAEWKRKYELERAKNLRLKLRELSTGETKGNLPGDRATHLISHPNMLHEADGNNGNCWNGTCNHEVLRDSEADCESKLVNGDTIQKASFKLTWNCKDDRSNQYKHDIVSFARGDIVTAERSSKQMAERKEAEHICGTACQV